MPTYPGQSTDTQLTTDVMLKNPRLISRRLSTLVNKKFIGARVLNRESADAVASGAMRYQRDESIYLDHDPEDQVGPRSRWVRTGWSEEVRTEAVKEHGLEVVINNLAIRRNLKSQREGAFIRLANNIARFMDGALIDLLLDDADVNHLPATVDWASPSANFLPDITAGQELIEGNLNGYNGFEGATLLMGIPGRDYLVNNESLGDRMPREVSNSAVQTGAVAPFLGISQILFSSDSRMADKAILLDASVAGVIAYEEPDPAEGFQGYQTDDGQAPVWTKVYKEEPKDTVVAGGCWPAMALIAPGAVVVYDDIVAPT